MEKRSLFVSFSAAQWFCGQASERTDNERGAALLTALLVMTLMLALGMAAVFSATVDTVITKSHRHGEQAFFVADAGVQIARRALTAALQEKIDQIKAAGASAFYVNEPPASAGQFPNVQIVPDLDQNAPFYQDVYRRTRELASLETRNSRLTAINGSRFEVARVQLTSASVTLTPPAGNQATEISVFRYWLQVTGTTEGGGSATVNETGQITTSLYLRDDSTTNPANRSFSFSGFGAFFDTGDSTASSALAAGTFSGPVHTNTHFAFRSDRNVAFRNIVSQVDNYIRYDSSNFNTGHRSIPNSDIKGIDISSEGYKQTGVVPLPENNFSQEYAVINATGITDTDSSGNPIDPPAVIPTDKNGNPVPVFDSNGRVTQETLAANMRNASNQSPVLSGGNLPAGVYIASADGSSITGAGIYVEGDASDVQLYAIGTDQYYVIKQGSGSKATTTTIQVSPSANTTSITSGSKSKTFTGTPTDRSDPENPQPGVSLFVDGSINSLRGGVEGSTKRPALASDTRVTVTAQRDITITGDLKYSDPVVTSDGTPVANVKSIQNVLGIFTNDGNVNLAPKSSYVTGPNLSLEMNAAVVSFNAIKGNDGGGIEGSIVYTGSSPKSTDKWKLVGSRVQSKINNIGYSNRDIFFDPRFAGGKFAPPFFPGTAYDLGNPVPSGTPEVVITQVDAPWPTGLSWFREHN